MAQQYPNTGGLRNFYKGDTKTIKGTVLRNGVPVDLTSWVIIFSLKHQDIDPDGDAVIRKPASIPNPVSGEFVLDLTTTDTDIDIGLYVWDIRMQDAQNHVQVVQKGTIWCLQPVTHSI